MTRTEILQALDYCGSFSDVLGRISEDFIEGLLGDFTNLLYFALRRYAVELGTPGEIENMSHEKLMPLAHRLLILGCMEKRGIIEVIWTDTPFLTPNDLGKLRITPKGY